MTTLTPQPPASEPVTLALPFSAESAAVARHQLRDWLHGHGAGGDYLDDARLVLSELVGNAVRHARPLSDDTLRVEWDRHDAGLDIAVTDGGSVSSPERLDAAVSDLILERWIRGEAADEGVSVSDREVEQRLEQIKQQNFGDEKEFQKFLEESGFS